MPAEPLIFVEIALMRDFPKAIDHLLTEKREVIDAQEAKVVVFDSILNCPKGLLGISFGNLLIKQVVAELRQKRSLPIYFNFQFVSNDIKHLIFFKIKILQT